MVFAPNNPSSPLRKQLRLQRVLARVAGEQELPVGLVHEVIAKTCGITSKRGCELYVDGMLRDHRLERPRRGYLRVIAP